MTDAAFIPLDEFEPANLATCGDGLFQSMVPGIFGNIIITTFGETRSAVYLDDPKGVTVIPLATGDVASRTGILWPRPSIEVVFSTYYDPERMEEAAGDLIVGPQTMIYAREPEAWFNDGKRTPLWAQEPSSKKPLGFRSWRLVSVVGERRRVIYTRTTPAEVAGS